MMSQLDCKTYKKQTGSVSADLNKINITFESWFASEIGCQGFKRQFESNLSIITVAQL